jgi:tRNA pseudouridine38-40 synthase
VELFFPTGLILYGLLRQFYKVSFNPIRTNDKYKKSSMNKKNFKLTIEYDGTHYHGWQRQKFDRTIQGEIEAAIEKMTCQKVSLIGSGRTDAGAHAFGQVANFLCNTALTAKNFQNGLNSLLDADIVIRSCEQVTDTFHARYDVVKKHYRYWICNRIIPPAVGRQYTWFIRHRLDIAAMCHAAEKFAGCHDFKAFEGSGSPRLTTVRKVFHSQLKRDEDGYLRFDIEAEGFLRFMVRNIVGTLVQVGSGKMPAEQVKKILASKDRKLAGPTAPSQGLFLMTISY